MVKSRHPGRVSSRAMELLQEVVEYGFGNSVETGMLTRFEKAFAKRFGSKYAVGLCNGTATMHCALAALGVKPGDEVIVPPLTAAATAYAVLHQGAVPVFADIDPDTFNIDPESVRKHITPLTKAVIPVGLYGLPSDIDPIMEMAKEHGLGVVEDNAECFLATYKGRMSGTIGHVGSFSFQASKHLTCGDGGVVVTDDRDLAIYMRRFGSFGFRLPDPDKGSVMPRAERGHPNSIRHDFLGWNYRLSELQAAVALEQTERCDELIGLRKQIGQMYLEAVADCSWLTPQYIPSGYEHSYWTFVCKFNAEKAGCDWDTFRNEFYANGGDFLYGAWRLTYNEPIFQNRNFLGGFFPIDSDVYKGKYRSYAKGLCPVAEAIQPQLMQFKANYDDLDVAADQAKALRHTIYAIDKAQKRVPVCV